MIKKNYSETFTDKICDGY